MEEADNMEEDIYEFVEKRGGGVSFVEISNQFGKGKYMFLNEKYNVVYWHGLTAPVVDALVNLMFDKKRVLAVPTTVIIYAMDGCVLTYPIMNRVPKNGYKEIHWLPLVLWTVDQAKCTFSEKTRIAYREKGYDV